MNNFELFLENFLFTNNKKIHIKIFEIQTFKISSLAPIISSEIENFLPDYLAICYVSRCGMSTETVFLNFT